MHGELTENIAKTIIYSDYYARFSNVNNKIVPVFSMKNITTSSWMKNFHYQQYLDYNEKNQQLINQELSSLGVYAHISDIYSSPLNELYNADDVLTNNHRVGLRSDIAYYDISSWTIVPEYHIVKNKINQTIYTIRFFLNTTKDTVLSDIIHPYYLFWCVAILVHPNDKRYKKLRWRDIILPITNKQVPIIPYEWVSIDWHWTKLLIPAHDAKDFEIALELNLPTNIYAFDKYGNFSQEAKHFAGKSLLQFSDNVLKYIDDISNLESTRVISFDEYRDKNNNNILFPLLQKNIYMNVGHKDLDDVQFVKDHHSHGNTIDFFNDIGQEEFFCITNQEANNPMVYQLWWYKTSLLDTQNQTNLLQDILCDYFMFGIISSPVRWDAIVDAFSLTYNNHYLWKMFYEYRIHHTNKQYENHQEIFALLESISSDNISSEKIDEILSYIDMDSYFIHTKNGYLIPSDTYTYHYDTEYVSLINILNFTHWTNSHLHFIYNIGDYKHIKHFLYLYSYLYPNLSPSISYYSLSTYSDFEWHRDKLRNTLVPDVSRLYLLQSIKISDYEWHFNFYSVEQIDRFLSKWWNLSRIIPSYPKYSLSDFKNKILEQKEKLSDYDIYLITKIYELYDEVVFLQSKDHIAPIISLSLSVIWDDLADIMLYILKKISSPVSDLVCSYVVLFANHILYPLLPTTTLWIIQWLWYRLERDFFQANHTLFIEKHYKSNLMLHIISQWYKNLSDTTITWFVLQANRDFLEYVKVHISDFKDFIWDDIDIRYLDESEVRPSDVVGHKIFTMQRWIIVEKEIIKDQTSPSLSVLQWQLQYKQQLLQTMKNTIIRMRSSGQSDKIDAFQTQIDTLLKEITDLEYQISKLKYF